MEKWTSESTHLEFRSNTAIHLTVAFGARSVSQWTADGGDQLSSALANAYQGLAEKIVDDVFLLQPLPPARLEADVDKQQTGDASDSKDDENST